MDPEWFVVVKQLWDNHLFHILRPEGKEKPTHTVHRNNLRPCPNESWDEKDPVEEAPEVEQSYPPTWWLPVLAMNPNQQVAAPVITPAAAPAQADPPNPPVEPAAPVPEPDPHGVSCAKRTNFGQPSASYESWVKRSGDQ